MVAFEQLRRDKCTLDVGHEAFSVGRTKLPLVLVVLDRWNGILYDGNDEDDDNDDVGDESLRVPAIDRLPVYDRRRGLRPIRFSTHMENVFGRTDRVSDLDRAGRSFVSLRRC